MSLNYKEYITKEKIEKFTKQPIAELKFDEKSAYVRLFSESMGPSPEFHVDDYNFKGINYTSSYDLSKKWQKFMLLSLPKEKGDKYIDDYNRYLDSQKITWEDIDYNEQQFAHQHKGI